MTSEPHDHAPAAEWSERLQSCLHLIDDPDDGIGAHVVRALVDLGRDAFADIHEQSRRLDDPLAHQRIRRVRHHWQQESLDALVASMASALSGDDDVLLRDAMALLDGFGFPERSMKGVDDLLTSMALRVHTLFITKVPANDLTQLMCVHTVLYEDEGFRGVDGSFYDPRHSYLSGVQETQSGLPIALCALELLLADRVDIELWPIGMPYHFLLYSPVLDVYIDAHHAGIFMGRADCIAYLQGNGITFEEHMLEPVRNVDMMMRMLRNLLVAHERREDHWEVARLADALRILTPTTPEHP